MHTILDPASSLESIYQQFPQMRLIPVAMQGTIIVGVPVGTIDFVNTALSRFLAESEQEFQKLIRFSFAHCLMCKRLENWLLFSYGIRGSEEEQIWVQWRLSPYLLS